MSLNKNMMVAAKNWILLDPTEEDFTFKKYYAEKPHYKDIIDCYVYRDFKIHIFISNRQSLNCAKHIIEILNNMHVRRMMIHIPYLFRSLYYDTEIMLSGLPVKIQRMKKTIYFWESETQFIANYNNFIGVNGDDTVYYQNDISIIFDYAKMKFVHEYTTYTWKAWCEHTGVKGGR